MIKGTNALEKLSVGDASISDEIKQLRDKAPLSILKRAVVVDVINDPSILTPDVLAQLNVNLLNSQLLETVPRNSIIARIISMGENKNGSSDIICYPFFPPYFSLPIKPGEQVWIFQESADTPQNIGFWMTRITEPDHVDDINYTHGDRRFDQNVEVPKTTSEKASKIDTKLPLNSLPGFSNGIPGDKNVTTLKKANDKDEPFDTIYNNAYGTKTFVMEPVPRFTKRPGDTVLQGSHNALISLGQDRGWTYETRPTNTQSSIASDILDNVPRPFSGTVDIVAGRGRLPRQLDPQADKEHLVDTLPRVIQNTKNKFEIDKNPTAQLNNPIRKTIKTNRGDCPAEGDPDFVHDASRIYVSMNTSGDKNFGLDKSIPEFIKSKHNVNDVDESPYVIVKSNEIRIIARYTQKDSVRDEENGSIRIIREDLDGSKICSFIMTHDGEIIMDSKKVVIGDGRNDQIYLGDEATEPAVLGDVLEKMLTQFCNTAGQAVGNLGQPIPQITTACNVLKSQLSQFKSKVTKLK